jgi:hypothetical protein
MSENTVFVVLKGLLEPYADKLILKHDNEKNYYLDEAISGSKAQMFAAAQIKKSYTSFHLFPVYCHPELLSEISDELKKRMQGKSCFNFKTVEQIPLDELEVLTKKAFESL